jgi:hypothetical protein
LTVRLTVPLTLVALVCVGGCSKHDPQRDGLAPYRGSPPTAAEVERAVARERASVQRDLDRLEERGPQEVSRELRSVEREQLRWTEDGERLTRQAVDSQRREARKRHAERLKKQQQAAAKALAAPTKPATSSAERTGQATQPKRSGPDTGSLSAGSVSGAAGGGGAPAAPATALPSGAGAGRGSEP